MAEHEESTAESPPGASHEAAATATKKGDYSSELRISLVLYGGSSLVVYMNGVAQELLNMVKSTSIPVLNGDTPAGPLLEAYDVAARVTQRDIDTGYADLLYADPEAGSGIRTASGVIDELRKRTSRRRLTIDVLSGASAGGLNAIFLSRALLFNGDVDEAAQLLVEYGDVVGILNDGTPEGETEPDPEHWAKSLLDGDRLYQLMLAALHRQRAAATGEPLVEAVDCYMALTEVRGVPTVPDVEVHAEDLEHRAVAHLQYGTLDSYGATRNDFVGRVEGDATQPELEPFLTFVGRATSAHPAAFHPTQLKLVADFAREFEDHRLEQTLDALRKRGASDEAIEAATAAAATGRFDERHELWSQIIGPVHHAASLSERWFSDGGNLDNKPFTHAIEPVKTRRASIPVDRKVVWVEPDPSKISADWRDTVAPNFWNITFGAYGLPRKEGIAGDLRDIRDRNRTASLLKESIEDAIAPHTWAKVLRDLDEEDTTPWYLDVPGSVERELYEVERARYVLDHLAEWCHRLYREAGGTKATRGEIHAAVDAHVRRDFTEDEKSKLRIDLESGRQWAHRRLLLEHDLPYRLRRLNHLDQLHSRRQRLFDRPTARATEWRDLYRWRTELTEEFLRLSAIDRRLQAEDHNETETRADDFDLPTLESVTEPGSGTPDGKPTERDRDLDELVAELLDRRRKALATPMAETTDAASLLMKEIAEQTDDGPPEPTTADAPIKNLGAELHKAWLDFDLVDMHLLPRFSDLRGELDSIETLRFSPSDTTLMGERPEQRLGGVGVAHFGAFFDKRWRLNDILWGRLDAAERIVKMLLPTDGLGDGDRGVIEQVQLDLIRQIQHRIIEQSTPAIEAIAELAPDRQIRPHDDDGPAVREKLIDLELDLSLAGDAQRKAGWKTILKKVPDVVGRVIALGGFDPWKEQQIGEDAPDSRIERENLVADSRTRAHRAGTLADGVTQLIAPGTWIPFTIRNVVLPLLAIAGLIGVWAAYGSHHNDLWWVGGSVLVGAAIVWAAGRLKPTSRAWRRRAPALRILGGLLMIAGILVPLVGEQVGLLDHQPSDVHDAFGYTLVFVAAGVGLAVVGLLGAVSSKLAKNVVMVGLLAVGLAALYFAARADYRTAILLFGSLMIVMFSGGLLWLLMTLKSKLDGVASKSGHGDDGH
ncbi:MAG: patatin-like protein [Actinomycetota bacterium]